MRARGINDLGLFRALERAPRALFMPPRFADIAGRDMALPIGCGQTSPPPSIVAAMIAALELEPEHRVCEIGTGTGYCAALLAQLANAIVSLERFQTLALEAAARIKAFGLANVSVVGRTASSITFRGSASIGSSSTVSSSRRPKRFAGLSARRRPGCGRRRPGAGRAAHYQTDRHDERGGRGS